MKKTNNITVSLVVTTYNNPQTLRLVLQSVAQQTMLPTNVIVADDGSNLSTKELINTMQTVLSVPIIHVWQEDKGYRRAKILNKAFAVSECDYIINIDGDIIMHPCFIADHVLFAKENNFYAGGRVRVKPVLTQQLINGEAHKLCFFTPNIKNRLNALHAPCLTHLFFQRDHFRGCNIAFWRSDLLKVNGYDERYEGYGLEDYDLVVRLLSTGVKKRFIKFAAIAFHLHHEERDLDRKDRTRNQKILDETKKSGVFWAEKGMSQYLEK